VVFKRLMGVNLMPFWNSGGEGRRVEEERKEKIEEVQREPN